MELTIDRLTKQYKNKIAVDRLSFSLTKGVTGLLGANGAGKTTLIRMLCGILVPTSGEITYNGISVSDEHYRNVLGYLPQEFGYYPEFTGKDFLMYFAALKGFTKKNPSFLIDPLYFPKRVRTSASLGLITLSPQSINIAKTIISEAKINITAANPSSPSETAFPPAINAPIEARYRISDKNSIPQPLEGFISFSSKLICFFSSIMISPYFKLLIDMF